MGKPWHVNRPSCGAFRLPCTHACSVRLDSFVQAHSTAGLRYFAFVDSEGNTVLAAGNAAALIDQSKLSPSFANAHALENVNGRLRALYMRPPLRRVVSDSDSSVVWMGG